MFVFRVVTTQTEELCEKFHDRARSAAGVRIFSPKASWGIVSPTGKPVTNKKPDIAVDMVLNLKIRNK